MAGPRDAEVDPRFDPLFQRGYDPGKHRTRVRPAARVEERAERTRLEPAEPRRVDVANGPEQESAGAVPDANPQDERESEYEPPRRNPFRLVLLAGSVAAIVGAGLLLWNRISSDPYYYGAPNSDLVAVFADNFVQAVLPALTTGGFIGLILWLGLGALRRHDRD